MPRMSEFVFDARAYDSRRGEMGPAMLKAAHTATRFSIPIALPLSSRPDSIGLRSARCYQGIGLVTSYPQATTAGSS